MRVFIHVTLASLTESNYFTGAQAAGLGSPGEIANQAVTVAEAATKIMDVARDEATKSKEFGRSENNEENIRKNFLDNTVNAIKEVTLGQYNIVICTDQAADEFIVGIII